MNILYLTNHLNVGGITSYVLTLGSNLKANGHNIYVASSQGELIPQLEKAGIGYISIPIKTKNELSPRMLLSLFMLRRAVRKYNIHIVHSQSRTTQVLGALLSKTEAVAHISTCHGFFKKRLSRRVFPCWGKRVIAISQQVKEHLINDFGVKEERIRLIHNGIDVDRFREQKPESRSQRKKDLGLGAGPVVGIVARLSDVKGHIYLIQAMKIVLEKFPTAQLLIVGEGKEKEKILGLISRLNLEKNIIWIPSAPDTAQVLSLLDIFVLPSLQEGLGLSLMEAMAAGLAVVGSDVGGIRTLIQDRVNGLLARPADSGALAEAISELLQDQGKRGSLGAKARDFIRGNFSAEKMAAQTIEVYSECLNVKE
ncbi:MAG: glycosyltransferase family 4 protein [Candidatus Omnitrophica bacterium]|nr:glycosyltransferase family 4 protein [Candidatus Omnitrophota bacterium]